MRPLLNRLLVIIAGTLLAVAGSSAAFAQEKASARISPELLEKIRKSNSECFACHSEEGLKNPPRQDMDLAKLRSL